MNPHRIGKVMIAAPVIERDPDAIAEALALLRVVPLRVERIAYVDAFECYFWSQALPEVPLGCTVPEYQIVVRSDDNGVRAEFVALSALAPPPDAA